MVNLKNKILDISNQVGVLFSNVEKEELLGAQRLLHLRLKEPQSYITLVGETSSGKSTIINGLFKQELLPHAARPTTGTITQVYNSNNIKKCDYFAINKNGTKEKLIRKTFDDLNKKPDADLLRLLIQLPSDNEEFNGLNLFDTPGYNSLVAEHEEVLRAFIPESDVIVYTVNYRVGFGEHDQILLSSIQDLLLDDDIPVLLVINRCPLDAIKNSKRIEEISSYASDCFHKTLEPYIIHSVIQGDIDNPVPVYPEANTVWRDVFNITTDEKRTETLLKRGKDSLKNLLDEYQLILNGKIAVAELNEKEEKELREILNDFVSTRDKLIEILNKYCNRWEKSLPQIIDSRFSDLTELVNDNINSANKWLDCNTCSAYIGSHLLPYNLRQISRTVENFLKVELNQMNREMEDMANQAIKKLEQTAGAISSPTVNKILLNLLSKLGMKMMGDTAKSMIAGLGGFGGLASGLGNLVKMGLKRLGGLFGKTFSRQVYANIGKFFTKEMVKKLNVAVTVIIEAGTYIIDSKTWQKKLSKKIVGVVSELNSELSSGTVSDVIENIRNTNLEGINELFEDMNQDFQESLEERNNISYKENLIKYNSDLIKTIELKKQLGGV